MLLLDICLFIHFAVISRQVTPLHLASQSGHTDMVKLLLSNKADISLRDASGRNALDMAVDEGHK